jgi:hypothetical protein
MSKLGTLIKTVAIAAVGATVWEGYKNSDGLKDSALSALDAPRNWAIEKLSGTQISPVQALESYVSFVDETLKNMNYTPHSMVSALGDPTSPHQQVRADGSKSFVFNPSIFAMQMASAEECLRRGQEVHSVRDQLGASQKDLFIETNEKFLDLTRYLRSHIQISNPKSSVLSENVDQIVLGINRIEIAPD